MGRGIALHITVWVPNKYFFFFDHRAGQHDDYNINDVINDVRIL